MDDAPLTLRLGYADGNVTNYDRPLTLLWRNEGQLTAREMLSRIYAEADAPRPERLMLSDAALARQRAGGTWGEIFSEGGLNGAAPWLVWLLAVEVIFILALPLAYAVFRWLPDRGVMLARPLGLLLTAWLAWLGASYGAWEFGRGSVALSIVGVALLSAWPAWRYRAELRAHLRRRWRYLLSMEALFLAAFFIFLALRAANPDLWHPWRGGEKPMELSYLTAVARSSVFPPYDPWYAGGFINYYYFGFVLVAALMRLTGIVPAIAYNLAVPLLFALTLTAAFSVGHNLAEALRQRARLRVSCTFDARGGRGGDAAAGRAGQYGRRGAVVAGRMGDAERGGVRTVRLLALQPRDGRPDQHHGVSVLDVPVRRPARAYDRHPVRAASGGRRAERRVERALARWVAAPGCPRWRRWR